MGVCHLEGIASLTELLKSDERARPGIVLIGSFSCPLYVQLLSGIETMAQSMPQFAFYDFIFEPGEHRLHNPELATIISHWRTNRQLSQVMLPSIGKPYTISAYRPALIRSELRRLY